MMFELPVAEEKVKPHQITALHLLCSLAFIGAGAIFSYYMPALHLWGRCMLAAGFALMITAIVKNKWLVRTVANRVFRIVELLMLAAVAIYTALQHWNVPAVMFGILCVAVLFALYWERPGNNYLYIRVDDEGVKLPVTSRRRFIDWTEIEHVLLKFGNLTIDCHNKRLFQYAVNEPGFDYSVFEAYCMGKIEEHRSKRRNDGW
jgi:hypothetical protein